MNALETVLMHADSWYWGVWHPSLIAGIVYTVVLTQITIVAVTLYLHRHSAHRSLELHPVLKHFFRFWLWLTTGQGTKTWTAIHRKHHAMTDAPGDPHSPKVFGIKAVLLSGAELYRASDTKDIREKYGKGTPDDWMERKVYERFTFGGIVSMALINVILLGPIGISVWAVQMMWIPVMAAGVINGIGHHFGYRNFECQDASKNVLPWGIFIGGEELHNNHHTYPNSAKLSFKPWEMDIGWGWIKLFQFFGLAQPLSTGPITKQIPGRLVVDIDMAWALMNDRFKVMANYAEKVIAPHVRQEYEAADQATRQLYKRAQKLLGRDETLVDAAGRDRISELMDSSPMLKTIYELKLQLLAVWTKRGGSADELLEAVRQWCLDAEASGIQALREFSEELKSYTMPVASR